MAFAAPTYLFAAGVFIMIVTGLVRVALGDAPVAESAQYGVEPHPGYGSLGFLALMLSGAARVLVRLYRADRRRGDRERRAGVPAAEGPQRPDDACR